MLKANKHIDSYCSWTREKTGVYEPISSATSQNKPGSDGALARPSDSGSCSRTTADRTITARQNGTRTRRPLDVSVETTIECKSIIYASIQGTPGIPSCTQVC